MKISELISTFEEYAPSVFQEDYDNSGLITGEGSTEITNALVCLDCLEEVVDEAISHNCNLIIAHHPIVFKGLKRFNGKNYVERTVIKALKNDIAIYAIHTNLDNVLENGVNKKIAEKLGLVNPVILQPKPNLLAKLVTFVPVDDAPKVRNALFKAGSGQIGNYDHCSFNVEGEGSYRALEKSNPYRGKKGDDHLEREVRVEVIFPYFKKNKVLTALFESHPYEEVAYDVIRLDNSLQTVGSGLIGELNKPMDVQDFLAHLKYSMSVKVIKHTRYNKNIKKIALCGGAGSFLLKDAIRAGADAYISSDFKYHEFFDAENKLMICDIGHFESEQFTPELIIEIIQNKFPNFAPILTKINTNPVTYYY
ncbi:MAG: Nif3-like dinuclear metal center hexameric protein [Flavobacteriales bacterium]|nr:Nif3-like dinuclear metal center hexameric protein [Flavobacteriales bacterium]